MKRVIFKDVKALLTSLFHGFPMWSSVIIAIFAFNQNFGVGLVIMLGLVAAQLILSVAISNLEWYRVGRIFNIVLNLTRVGTILSFLAFMLKSGLEINPFGSLGLVISIVTFIISLLLFLLFSYSNSDYSSYEYLGGILSILVLISLLVFSYLYFTTQLIWIPALLSLVFSCSKGFWELDDMEYGTFTFLTPLSLGLVSVISTVVQFSQEIWNWMSNSLEVIIGIISSFLSLELFQIPLWLYVSVLVTVIIIKKTVKIILNKSAQKREQEEAAEKAAEKEKIKKEKRDGEIKRLLSLKKDDFIFDEDILFVISNLSNNYFSVESAAFILGHGDLFRGFVEVSNIKRQIFYRPVINSVLDYYKKIFKQTTNDEILFSLIAVIHNLTENLNKVADYKGVADLRKSIRNVFGDIPQFEQII